MGPSSALSPNTNIYQTRFPANNSMCFLREILGLTVEIHFFSLFIICSSRMSGKSGEPRFCV